MFAAIVLAVVTAAPQGSAEGTAASAPLLLRPKAAIATMTPTHNSAPFVAPAFHEPDLLAVRDSRMEQSRSSCSSARTLCYDAGSGRIVYKPARALMPAIPGLQRENISVKRDRIVLRYTF